MSKTKTLIPGKIYRSIVEDYKKLPFGIPIRLTSILGYVGKTFGYFETEHILIEENDLLDILVEDTSLEQQYKIDIADNDNIIIQE